MIHPIDEEILESLLGVAEIPEDIEAEYEIRRRMYHGAGGSGPLLASALVPMLRFLGLEMPARKAPVVVDWREHIGDSCQALYGSKKFPGVVVDVVEPGWLLLDLEGMEGCVEIPCHAASLAKGAAKGVSAKRKRVEKQQ